MIKCDSKHYLELMPATCLQDRETWQKRAKTLPLGSYLLVSNPQDERQTRLMLKLRQLVHQRGREVVMWAVDDKSDHI